MSKAWRERRILLAATLLLSLGSSHAALRAIEQAWELPLAAVTMPFGASGQLVVRRCPGCRVETLRVTADTRYFVRPGRQSVALADLRRAAKASARRRGAMAFIYYEPKSRIARRVILDPGS
jgi:hypothetical protein